MNIKINRLLDHIRSQSLRTLRVGFTRQPPSRSSHARMRPQIVFERVALWKAPTKRGERVFVAGSHAVLFGDGERVDLRLKLEDQAAQ